MLRKIKAELANCQERLKALEIKRGEDLYEQTHKEQKAPENPMDKLIDEQLRMLQEINKRNNSRFSSNGAYARYADALSLLSRDIWVGLEDGHFALMDATLYSVNSITRNCALRNHTVLSSTGQNFPKAKILKKVSSRFYSTG